MKGIILQPINSAMITPVNPDYSTVTNFRLAPPLDIKLLQSVRPLGERSTCFHASSASQTKSEYSAPDSTVKSPRTFIQHFFDLL